MATDAAVHETKAGHRSDARGASAAGVDTATAFRQALAPLASLKLTVVLLAISIFLVFAGTLALVDRGIWHVVGGYFRTPLAWIEFQIFFPRDLEIPGGFWFPGGWSVGVALAVNLIAAHTVRFKVQARGAKLVAGLAFIAAGIAATAGVIVAGNNMGYEGALSEGFRTWLWHGFRAALVGVWFAASAALFTFRGERRAAWSFLLVLAQLVGGLAVWLIVDPSVELAPASMRILWQLTKATAAGLILLVGCNLVFGKRGGIVLLHSGVALMMLGELLTGTGATEGVISLREGETGNYVMDLRAAELAIIDQSASDEDRVTVVSQSMLRENARANAPKGGTGSKGRRPDDLGTTRISDDRLPLDLRVLRWYPNSKLVSVDSEQADKLGNRGLARLWAVEEEPVEAGASTGSGVDRPAVFVEIFDKPSGKSRGIYLFHVEFDEAGMHQTLDVDGRQYAIALRLKRGYKSYEMTLVDVRADKYVGTETPKNYSSNVRLVDAQRNEDRTVTIWMNNPFRYEGSGETFYQQGYAVDSRGNEVTTLQVVANRSWMIPYVACMLVTVGLLAQFLGTLVRFLNRRQQATKTTALPEGIWPRVVPVLLVVCAAAYLGSRTRQPPSPPGSLKLQEASRLPIAFEGRVKPLDTLARNNLKIISGREAFYVEVKAPTRATAGGNSGDEPQTVSRPPVEWLLDVIANTRAARRHKVFRIDNPQVLDALGLEPRKGFRYALGEIENGETNGQSRPPDAFLEQVATLRDKEEKEWDPAQKAFAKTWQRLNRYRLVQESFHRLDRERLRDEGAARSFLNRLTTRGMHAVPPLEINAEARWEVLPIAEVLVETGRLTDAAPTALRALLDAYAEGNPAKFNVALAEYGEILSAREDRQTKYLQSIEKDATQPGGVAQSETLSRNRVRFEAFVNRFDPFTVAMVFYLAAFALACVGWIGWPRTFQRASLWLLVLTFVLHTAGLAARIYISGRPPVTNLYSSAVFVGWGCVLLGIIFETIYGLGLGNIVAAASGFSTLLIADRLGLSGDTIKVMQAVLDTNFWLATHVVCISFGYATTFVAGLFGLLYVLRNVFTPTSFDATARHTLTRVTYGTLCFALLFSFVGTVLGGLWADDSWGRFWGWDPKENGALIIVLWNALVLHARWGKIAGPRGLAVLAVVGNIVTAWSWFGVNALEVGLHSYGFDDSTVRWLIIFVASQLAVIVLGILPVAPRGVEREAAAAT